MTTFDCCMVYNELDMLEVRFSILKDAVDFHVIVEAGETHSGNPKPRYIADAMASGRFAAFADKILYGYVGELEGADSWARERFHRRSISHILHRYAKPDDLIIVGDADEIPNPAVLPDIGEGARLELDFYYYNLNHRVRQGWSIGALRWGREHDPNQIRTLAGHDVPQILNGGWHFSYFMSPEKVVDKLDAFMHHADIAADVPRDPAWLGERMRRGEDIIGRGLPIERVPLQTDTLPAWLLQNLHRYPGWVADGEAI